MSKEKISNKEGQELEYFNYGERELEGRQFKLSSGHVFIDARDMSLVNIIKTLPLVDKAIILDLSFEEIQEYQNLIQKRLNNELHSIFLKRIFSHVTAERISLKDYLEYFGAGLNYQTILKNARLGKLSIKQAQEIIDYFLNDPELYTIQNGERYPLDNT